MKINIKRKIIRPFTSLCGSTHYLFAVEAFAIVLKQFRMAILDKSIFTMLFTELYCKFRCFIVIIYYYSLLFTFFNIHINV